jgi:hypothetical protein
MGTSADLPLRHLDGGCKSLRTTIEWREGKEMMGPRKEEDAEMRKRENRSSEADSYFSKGLELDWC